MPDNSLAQQFSLAWLIDPLEVHEFVHEIFSQRRYYCARHDQEYFHTLAYGEQSIDLLISALSHDVEELFTVRGEDHHPGSAYLTSTGSLDRHKLEEDFHIGYTIVVNSLERFIPSLTALSNALERELNYPTHINGYISPPWTQGFVAHYDPHDVFAVQIYGQKYWSFYGDDLVPAHHIHRSKKVHDIFPSGLPPAHSLTSRVGDTLYLPAGCIHQASTHEYPSVHLTIGIHVPTVFDVLNQALNSLSFTDERIHQRLPPGYLHNTHQDAYELIRRGANLLGDDHAMREGLDAFEDLLVRRGQPPPLGCVHDALGVDGDMHVMRYQPLYARVVRLEDRVGLQFAQLLISADLSYESAFQYLCETVESFQVNQIPGLSLDQQIRLVRQLITNGFLRPSL